MAALMLTLADTGRGVQGLGGVGGIAEQASEASAAQGCQQSSPSVALAWSVMQVYGTRA